MLISTIFILSSAGASAGMTSGELIKAYSENMDTKKFLDQQFKEMFEGINAMNMYNGFKDLPKVICPPGKLYLSGEVLFNIYKRRQSSHPKLLNSDSDGRAFSLLLALEDVFPCK